MARSFQFAQTLATIALIASCGLLAVNAIVNPMNPRRAQLADRLLNAKSADLNQSAKRELDYVELRELVTSKASLWQPLVEPPKAPAPAAKAPDLNKELQGLTVLKQSVGKGDGIQVKMRTREKPQGEFYRKGDTANGLTIKSIGEKEILFSKTVDGQEYTILVPR